MKIRLFDEDFAREDIWVISEDYKTTFGFAYDMVCGYAAEHILNTLFNEKVLGEEYKNQSQYARILKEYNKIRYGNIVRGVEQYINNSIQLLCDLPNFDLTKKEKDYIGALFGYMFTAAELEMREKNNIEDIEGFKNNCKKFAFKNTSLHEIQPVVKKLNIDMGIIRM